MTHDVVMVGVGTINMYVMFYAGCRLTCFPMALYCVR